jgi:hypothetical protein
MAATPGQISEVREMIGETDTTASLFTDDQITAWIDAADSLEAAALTGWQRKAAHWAGLVNVTDGAAAREFSDLFDHAVAMIKVFTKLASPTAGRTRVGKIVRSS